MKIIVMSDSHLDQQAVQKVLELQEDADLFIHLGDGEREMNRLLQSHPWLGEKLFYLKGNCDAGTLVPQTQQRLIYTLPYGHRIFAAHGDAFRVKFTTAPIIMEAMRQNCDIVLYGHTHIPMNRYEDGMYILNPGSIGCPIDGYPASYMLLSISEKGVLPNIVEL